MSGPLRLLVPALLLLACSRTGPLELSGGASSATASASSSSSGVGGGEPNDCASLILSGPVELQTSGLAERPKLAFGTSNGRTVSIFHGLTPKGSMSSELHTLAIEPWEQWPPTLGTKGAVDPIGGATFAVTNAAYGAVSMLLYHHDSIANDGLFFVSQTNPNSTEGLVAFPAATAVESPRAVFLSRGYDTPPVAFNYGYVAMLAAWEVNINGAHALKYAVSDTGVDILQGFVTRPDDDDLACASGPIVADGVRYGLSWLVAAGSGSPSKRCDGFMDKPPTSLAIDKLAWGAPTDVDWTRTRTDDLKGDGPIKSIRMAPAADGAWVVFGRENKPLELVHVDPDGKLGAPADLGEAPVESEITALSALSKGSLLGLTAASNPKALQAQWLDRSGRARTTAVEVLNDAPIDLSVIASPDGKSALFAWSVGDQRLFVERVQCEGAGT
jgi:hypothetical protein